jgi:hypothetical protein
MATHNKSLDQHYSNNSSNKDRFVAEATADQFTSDQASQFWNYKKNPENTQTSTKRVDSVNDIYQSQISTSKIADTSKSDAPDLAALFDPTQNARDKLLTIGGEILNQLQREEQLRTEISENIGLSGDLLNAYQDSVAESAAKALEFGYNMSQVSDMVSTLGKESGRFNLLSKDTMDKSYATSRAFVGTLNDMAKTFGEFEKVGYGAADTLKQIDTAGRSSISLGLNAKKTTELLRTDLGKLNEYGFSAGVQGLNRMVQKSLEFRMSMGEVFKIADKVMSPDSAIELTANLQVLGGAIGDFNDPLKLMYMATNNVEGLQDALIGAAGNLATFNKEQGRFEITGINLRRAKEMASQMGISYQELAKGAVASQERMAASTELMSRGLKINKEDKEFITNMSQMKDGKMVITIPESLQDKLGGQQEILLSKLDEKQIQLLKDNRKALENLNPEDLAKGQFSSVKNIENMMKSQATKIIRDIGQNTLGRKGAQSLEKATKPFAEQVKVSTDRTLQGKDTRANEITSELSAAVAPLTSVVMGQLQSIFQKVVEGRTNEDQEYKSFKKKKDDYYKESNPSTNQMVIKSMVQLSINKAGDVVNYSPYARSGVEYTQTGH